MVVFCFLLDTRRSRLWLKASSTIATNPRDGLVALAPLH